MARRPPTDPPRDPRPPAQARPRHDPAPGRPPNRGKPNRGNAGEPVESGRNSGRGSEATRRTES